MTSDLRPYGGGAKRKRPIFEKSNIGPWGGKVKVTPVEGLTEGTRFEVTAEWFGPGMPDLPPSDVPVHATDLYWLRDAELAVSVAKAAIDALREPRLPDLREIAQLLA